MSSDYLSLVIDGHSVTVPAGSTVLEAAQQAGIEIPTLCWLPKRAPWASCLVCAVEIEGQRRLVPACATVVQAGQVVRTDTEKVVRHRKTTLELLLSDHAGDCLAPCLTTCPAHLDVPGMNQAVARGDLAEAAQIVKDTIPFPAVLGRICPTPCEARCRRKPLDGALSVCMLKRFVGDSDIASDTTYVPQAPKSSGKRVGIIGAGPAGLAAAYFLIRHGHECVVYDEQEKPGGAWRTHVPEDRLPREVIDAEVDVIRQMGADFRLGRRVQLDEIRGDFDAVVLAIGPVPKDLPIGDIDKSERGLKVVKGTGETNVPGIFATGAAVAPGKISVRSIGDAHLVADAVHAYLNGEPIRRPVTFDLEADRTSTAFAEGRLPLAENAPRTEPKGDGLTLEEAKHEAARCLQCGCAKSDVCVLRDLAARHQIDASRFRGPSRPIRIDDSHDEIIFEESKCTSCGICVRIAAEHGEELGLAFRGRGFETRVAGPFGAPLATALKTAARACAEACPTGALYVRGEKKTP